MDNLTRIRAVSRKFERVCAALLVLAPLALILYWVFFNDLPDELTRRIIDHVPPGAVPPSVRILGLAVTALPCAAFLYGLASLRRLFTLYREGAIFSAATVACYRRLGRALLLWAAATMLEKTLLTLAMTIQNPPGQRMLTIGIGSSELTLLFVGGVVLVVSWVMDEGRRLEEEQALTI